MKAPDILANVSRGWNRDPAGLVQGTARTGLSAAFWEHGEDAVQDVSAEPDLSRHIVCLPLSSWRAEFHLDGRTDGAKIIPASGVQMINAGCRPRAVNWGRWRVLHIYLPVNLVEELAADTGSSASSALELIDPNFVRDRAIERIGAEMLTEMRNGASLAKLRIDALGQDLAIQLLRRWSNLAGAPALVRELQQHRRGGLAPWQVRRVTECLEAHLADDLSLAALAGLVGLSPNHFCTAFRLTMGEPPHRWLVRRRIERAQQLLANPRLSVTDIALAVGFGSSAHFSTAFRKDVGLAPSAYRRERLA